MLLPILGIGPFLLPRFFRRPSPHDFPEPVRPSASWLKKAGLALAAGLLLIASFLIEALGYFRAGHALRVAINAIAAGMLVLFPASRVSLLQVTLAGGFATFVAVTRVLFRQSGNLEKLEGAAAAGPP